jgi:hypothetical protein
VCRTDIGCQHDTEGLIELQRHRRTSASASRLAGFNDEAGRNETVDAL